MNNKNQIHKDRIILAVLLLMTLSVWLGWWVYVSYSHDMSKDAGAFGDLFGGATALFSGLAFAGMIYAIILQTRELGYQRTELELQRHEMKKTSRNELLTAKVSALSSILGHVTETAAFNRDAGASIEVRKHGEKAVDYYAGAMIKALGEIQSTLDEN